MASITGLTTYINMGFFGSTDSLYGYGGINTSTERFKGSVTGYKGTERTQSGTSANAALTSEETDAYTAELKALGDELKSATANLAKSSESVFNSTSGTSSNEEALTVSVSNKEDAAKFNETNTNKNVSVQQLASTQKNTGTTLTASGLNGADKGTNRFTVETGGKTYELSVNISSTDSARTAQQKMADAINNNKNLGISATVEYDQKSNKSALVLTAKESGGNNGFTIADVAGQGSLVSALGAGNTTTEARDAIYTVDGTRKTSATNKVDLGNGLTGNLKKATTQDVKVSTKKDVAGIANAVNNVINQFNSILETAKDYGSDKGAKALQQRMHSISLSYASSLQKIGITSNKAGYLQVDEKKLTTAFESGSAERYLGDNNAGFTQRLSQLAKTLSSNPEQFVSYQSRNNTESSYASSGYNSSYNSYLSAYKSSQIYNIGMLFSAEF